MRNEQRIVNQVIKAIERTGLAPGTVVIVNLTDPSANVNHELDTPVTDDAVQTGRLSPIQARQRRKCKVARQDFMDYVKNLDQTIFTKACQKLQPNELYEYNRMINNPATPYEEIRTIVKKFKANVNDVILEEIMRLKSMMS